MASYSRDSTDQPIAGDNTHAEILARCLKAIESGDATIESCVAQYPNFSGLGDLLGASRVVQKFPQATLRESAKADIRERMLAKQRAMQVQARPIRRSASISWWRRVAVPVAAALVILFGGSTALVRASGAAVPGDGLYGLKRAVEQIELSFADNQARSELLYRDAQTRLAEVSTLTERRQLLTDDVLKDVAQCISAAVAAQPDRGKSTELLLRAKKIFEQAESQALLPPNVKEQALKLIPTLSSTATATSVATSTSVPATSMPSATFTVSPTFTPTPTSTPTATPTVTESPTVEAATQEPTETISETTGGPGSLGKKPTQKPRPTQKPKPTQANPNSGGKKGGDPPDNGGNSNPKGGGNK
jgi:hypothetical protein